jgi:hypothetical protein
MFDGFIVWHQIIHQPFLLSTQKLRGNFFDNHQFNVKEIKKSNFLNKSDKKIFL